ncbi:unnamed protein product [Schistocephalus solidus]|uniref:Plastin-3 n=1 Tax=Schistocephalus solidus TaxID=70667 RepID=A0A183SDK6_SCHSO|nr:unnamed protein product [Schistocephalus solidus]
MGSRDERLRAKPSDILTVFALFDKEETGYLAEKGVLAALKSLGFNRSPSELKAAIKNCEIDFTEKKLNISEFKRVYQEMCKQEAADSYDPLSTRTTIYQYGSSNCPQGDDTIHSVSEDEQVAFCGWLESKIINCSAPDTIDLRALHRGSKLTRYQVMENITLALNSARAIGCNVVNIDAADIQEGTRHLLLGLLWQIIKIGLLRQINVVAHAELVALLDDDETITEFAKLSPEEILMRWVNYHLKRSNCDVRMENFSFDIKDCEVYAYLLEQISPPEKKPFLHSAKAILDAVDLVQRAEMVLQNAEKLNCRVFVQPKDIITGSQKLNLAFLANLFNTNPALEKPAEVEPPPIIEETREEKTYRNWINSMGLRNVVNNLYTDLFCDTVIFELYDLIRPRTVDWSRVTSDFAATEAKAKFQQLENCNYIVEIGKRSGFSLVGVAGSDLKDGLVTPTLALLWQLMRAYTLSLLARLARRSEPSYPRAQSPVLGVPLIAEQEIIDWANNRLRLGNKARFLSKTAGFGDIELRTSLLILDLLDAIRPGCVDYSVVNKGNTPADRLSNAQYAVGVARRLGAKIYAVPEDITEVKGSMVMTVFACLMAIDLEHADKRAPISPSTDNKTEVLNIDIAKTETPRDIKMTNLDFQNDHSTEAFSSPSTTCLHCGRTDSNRQSPISSEFPSSRKEDQKPSSLCRKVTSPSNENNSSAQWVRIPTTSQTRQLAIDTDCRTSEGPTLVETGTSYNPPIYQYFGSPPVQRTRHFELFSSPRLYRSDLTKSTNALDEIKNQSPVRPTAREEAPPKPTSHPPNPKLISKLARKAQERAIQCENRAVVTSPNWNRVSKKSEIFAASVREGAASVYQSSATRSRRDIRSPTRSSFAAAYEEYAQKTVDAVKRHSSSRGGHSNGGRVFMAADIPK